jgi:type II secretory pathway pseudopilin PulG
MKQLRKQSGYSIMEITVVLAIMLFLAAIVFGGVSKLRENSQTNAAQAGIAQIQAGINNLYAGKPVFTGLTQLVLLNGAQVPANMIGAANTIINPWKGIITVAPAALGGIADSGYSITYPSVPQGPCSSLVSNAGVNFEVITVNGTNVKAFGNPAINVATVTTACQAGGTANALVFTGK